MCLDVACINKNATKERMELELKKKKKIHHCLSTAWLIMDNHNITEDLVMVVHHTAAV